MKKYFSLLLICILLIGILPFSVRAEDGENTEIPIPPNNTEPVKWTISLKDDETYEIVGMESFRSLLMNKIIRLSCRIPKFSSRQDLRRWKSLRPPG